MGNRKGTIMAGRLKGAMSGSAAMNKDRIEAAYA
jgi:hypothetical protein